MINFCLYDDLNIKIDTDNWDYLRAIKDNFSYFAHNYRFMPRYKSGIWDGKISLFNAGNQTIPFGLMLDLLKYHKKEWPDVPYTLSDDVKKLFNGIQPIYKKDLLFSPYDYQDDCISACLKTSKGIIRSATASGKSIMISYVLRTLWESGEIKNAIIIVPSIGLVTQFYTDMEDYGIDMSLIGRVGDEWKEWNKPIIISTWQSLQNVPEHMERMDCVIVDEVHGAKAVVLSKLLQQATNARYRFGFTGTMPSSLLEQNQVKSYLGPILKEYGSVELAKLGYVAKCVINMVYINYNEKLKGTYNEIKDACFNNIFRLGIIKNIILSTDGNILLLVGKVEDEGELLKELLIDDPLFNGYEIEFLSGRDDGTEREKWRKYMDNSNNTILIATYGIFQQGINIKSLSNLILASPFKSKVRVLQSIGRTLRLHADKKNGAIIWDICDRVKYLDKHADTRMKHYSIEGFEVIDHELIEGDIYENTLFDKK
jgi:superfamily II DNA or RNA helicase